jgi:hypothetical protein
MELAIVLSLAAILCTATASICQRIGARRLEREGGHQVHGFDSLLVFRLAGQPAWLLGFGSMLAGFAFQVSALHFRSHVSGGAALATELLGLIVLAIGVWTLSGSWLIIGAESGRADCKPGESGERATQELIRRSS